MQRSLARPGQAWPEHGRVGFDLICKGEADARFADIQSESVFLSLSEIYLTFGDNDMVDESELIKRNKERKRIDGVEW